MRKKKMKDGKRYLQTSYKIRVHWKIKDDLKRRKAIDRDGLNS